jgi:membrane protease YdiL (CAAX protease family)
MTSPSPSEPRTDRELYHAPALAPRGAALVVLASVFVLYAVQIGLAGAGAPVLVAATTGHVVVTLGLGFVVLRKLGRTVVGLTWPRPRFLAAGALVGVSAWYVNLLIVLLLRPPGDARALEALVEQTPLVPTILAIALVPAISEELVFRGVLLRALATRLRASLAIALAAAVFAVYHLFPPQMVSTFLLGLVLGYLTLRAGSVVPAMLAHLLNNTIAIAITRDEVPAVRSWIGDHPVAMLAGCVVVLAAGLGLAARGPA